MNIAFQAAALFLLTLPGIVFRSASSIAKETRTKVSLPERFTQGLVAAVITHAIGIPIANLVGHSCFSVSVDLSSALMLVMGKYGKDDAKLAGVVESVTAGCNPVYITAYLLLLLLASFLFGKFVRGKRVDRYDKKAGMWFECFTDKNVARRFHEWLGISETPQTDGEILTLLTAGVMVGHVPYLYLGWLDNVHFGDDGNPDRFVLSDVYRRKFSKDAAHQPTVDADHNTDERYYQVVASTFVVRYSEITTLNLRHFHCDATVVSDTVAETLPTDDNPA